MSKIHKNYLYNIAYQIVVLLVPLVSAPYLTRVLGAQGIGIYGYVHSVTALICTAVMLGIFGYGSRQIAYVRDNPEKLKTTFWAIMTDRILIAVVGTIIYAVVVWLVGRYKVYFLLYYTYLLGYFLDCTWLFVGVEDMKWAVLKNTLMKLLALAGLFAFVKSKADVWKYVLIQGGSILLANLLAYTQLKRYVGRARLIFSGLWNDLRESALLFLPTIAQAFYLQCDKIMLELMANATEQVAYYDYAEKITMIPLSFITVLSTVMMPRIANEFKKERTEIISELLNKAAKFSMFLAFPLMFGMIAVSGKLIPWYLGSEFLPTATAICMISPIIIANTLSGISGGQYFTATNQIKILLGAQVFAAVGNLVVNALLIPRYGYMGAAAATVMSSLICAAVQYHYLLKQVSLPGLIQLSGRYCALAIIMYTIIYLISWNMTSSPLTTLIQIGSGAAVYFLACVVVKDETFLFLVDTWRSLLQR